MGYRSDVGLCLTAAGKQVLDTALAEAAGSNPHFTEIKNMVDHAEIRTDTDSGTVGYLWRDLKWYADYDEVRFIENLLSKLDDSDYLFIRVGESDDDTEDRGGFWENPLGMCLVRGIAFD